MSLGEMTYHLGRKDRPCAWCGQVIPKAEKRAHFKGKWEGDWQNWQMHEECYEENQDEISEGFDFGQNIRPEKRRHPSSDRRK